MILSAEDNVKGISNIKETKTSSRVYLFLTGLNWMWDFYMAWISTQILWIAENNLSIFLAAS